MLEVLRKIVNSFPTSNLFVFWIGFLPFVVWNSFYEGPKVFYFLTGSFFVCCYMLVKTLKSNKLVKIDGTDLLFLLWLIMLSLSSLAGIHPLESFLGGSYRHQGVIFFFALWLLGKTISSFSQKSRKLLTKAIAVGVLIEGSLVIAQFVAGNLYFGKPLGTIGEANAVAAYLALGSYFIYSAFPLKFLVLTLLSILLTASRAGVLAVATFLAGINKKLTIPITVLALVLAVSFTFTRSHSDVEDRALFWKLGIEAVGERPFIGYGAESGEFVYDSLFTKQKVNLESLIIDRSHNLFLDLAMWSGIPGLIFFSFWFFWNLKKVEGNKKFALLAFLVYSMFQPISIVHWILLVITINI